MFGGQTQRFGAGARHLHLVAAAAQQRRDGALDRGLVVDEQDARCTGHVRASPAASGSADTGISAVTIDSAAGRVLGPHAAALRLEQLAGDPQAHAGPGRPVAPAGPAVEPLEQPRHVGLGQSGAVVADRDRQSADVDAGADVDGGARRRVLGGVLEHVRQRRRGQPRIDAHRLVTADGDVHGMPPQRPADLIACGGRRFPTDGSGAAALATPPASIRAISRMFSNSRSRRSTSTWMTSVCSARSPGDSAAAQVGSGDANRGERRPQVVAERRQQRRLQLLALPGELGGLALLEKARPLDANGDDAGQRVEGAGLHRPPGGGEQADWPGADAQRHQAYGAAVARHGPVPGVGTRVGVELQGGLGGRERRGEFAGVERHRLAGCEDVPLLVVRQGDGDRRQVEPPGHRPREGGQRFAALGRHQHVAAEVEEPGQFVAPAHRFRGPGREPHSTGGSPPGSPRGTRTAPPSSAGRR